MIFTKLPFELSGELYRSVMPFGNYDPEGTLIERFQKAEIDSVVVLADDPEILAQTSRNLTGLYKELGLEVIHLPIMDFGTPDPEELRPIIETTIAAVRAGKNVVIHCNAGIGRTGLFTACLAKTVLNLKGQDAIEWTRQAIPGAIETPEQAKFIRSYIP